MKKLCIVFALLIAASSSILYYYWQQVTKLPNWYNTQSHSITANQEFSNPSEVRSAEARVQAKIEAAEQNDFQESLPPVTSTNASSQNSYKARQQQSIQKKNIELELSDQEFNDLVTSTVAKHLNHNQSLSTVPKLHTTIQQGNIESGTVINLSEIPKNQLTATETDLLKKIQKTFPFLNNQKIYVGIAGQPKIEDGKLKLDNNPQVKLGNLSISLSALSQRLNIPQAQLEQKLNKALQVGSLKVNDLELIDNKVRLRGSVNK